ncbi:hypothetical protein FF1_008740 [Malus domestica]
MCLINNGQDQGYFGNSHSLTAYCSLYKKRDTHQLRPTHHIFVPPNTKNGSLLVAILTLSSFLFCQIIKNKVWKYIWITLIFFLATL